MECIFVIGFIVVASVYLYQTQVGKEVWCENCNKWSQMNLQASLIRGYICPHCKWINQEKQGTCPTCGWYGRYINKTISRRGPFKKVDRTPITPFYGWQEEYWAYEETIQCPKHGTFTAYTSVDASRSPVSKIQDQSDAADYGYEDEDQYYDSRERDDDYHPRGLY